MAVVALGPSVSPGMLLARPEERTKKAVKIDPGIPPMILDLPKLHRLKVETQELLTQFLLGLCSLCMYVLTQGQENCSWYHGRFGT